MSSHLKMVFSSSIGLLLLFAWHFATVFGIAGSPPESRGEFFIRFGVFVVVAMISAVVSSVFIARKDENAVMPDEREEKIELMTDRYGNLIVYAGMIVLMWFVFTPMEPMQVANAILGIICVTEVFKLVIGFKYLRHGV